MSIVQETAPAALPFEIVPALVEQDIPVQRAEEIETRPLLDQLRDRVEQLRAAGSDAYDYKEQQSYSGRIKTNAIIASGTVASSFAAAALAKNPDLLYPAAAGLEAIVSNAVRSAAVNTQIQKSSVKDGLQTKAFGLSIELIAHHDEQDQARVAAVLVPVKEGESSSQLGKRQAKDLAIILQRSGVDDVVLPPELAKTMYPVTSNGSEVDTLAEQLRTLKPSVALLPVNRLLQGRSYMRLASEDLVVNDRIDMVRELQLLPAEFPREKQEAIRGLLDRLSRRFDLELPFASERNLVPANIMSIDTVVSQYRPYAQQYLANVGETELAVNRITGERRKIEYYSSPSRTSDQFEVELEQREIGGEATRHIKLAEFAADDTKLAEILSHPEIVPSDILPAIGRLLKDLKALDEHYRKPAALELREVGVPVEGANLKRQSIALQSSGPQLEIHGLSKGALRRQRISRSLGTLAAFTAVTAALSAGAAAIVRGQTEAPPFSSSPTSIGQSSSAGGPIWRIEALGDADTAGYYAMQNNSRYEPVAQQWMPSAHQQRTRLEQVAPEKLAADRLHVAGWLFNDNSQGLRDVPLPVRALMSAVNVKVTDAEGNEVNSSAYKFDDGTYVVRYQSSGRANQISYELIQDGSLVKPNSDLEITGVTNHAPEDGRENPLSDWTGAVADNLTYDNTNAVTDMLALARSPESFERALAYRRIGNCGVANTLAAIISEQTGSTEKQAFTTGFMIDSNEEHFLTVPHAWLTDSDGSILDATPSPRGRTAEEVGLPNKSEAELEQAWQRLTEAAKQPPDQPPFKELGIGLAAFMAAGTITQRGGMLRRRFQDWQVSRNRHLTPAQAERILISGEYGDPRSTEAPILDGITESLPVALNHVGDDVLAMAAKQPQGVAPYLTKAQQRELSRYAKQVARDRLALVKPELLADS